MVQWYREMSWPWDWEETLLGISAIKLSSLSVIHVENKLECLRTASNAGSQGTLTEGDGSVLVTSLH
jgi:hypothetical protein